KQGMSRRMGPVVLVLVLTTCGPQELTGRPHSSSGGDASGLLDAATRDSAAADAASSGDLLSVGPDLSAGHDAAYTDPGRGDGGQCMPPAMAPMCPGALAPNAGCLAHEDCGASGHGNGLDDDCNGKVDDGCTCTPGDVEPCFLGPPAK